ncbi:MAG: OmpA family protein [Polyangiaceae bacterium]|nr:OmpA family protein [Polyangiaceae bacterium]
MARPHLLAAGIAAAVVLFEGAAFAQKAELDIDRFDPAVTYGSFGGTIEGSPVRDESDRWEIGLLANYAHNPLVVANDAGELDSTIVGTRLGFDLFASVTIIGPLALGLDIPLFIAQTGDADPDIGGIGDVRLVPKVRILDDRDSVGLGIVAELRVPSHYGDFSGGARNVVFWPRVILDHAFGVSGFRMGTNLGVEVREGTNFFNVSADSEFTYGGALAYRFGGADGKVELGVEADGAVGLVEQDVEELPFEISPYLKGDPHPEWEIMGGPGFGVVPGFGEPIVRGYIGFRYKPTSHDKDYDGVPDDEDKCPDVAENLNGIEDRDGCPDEDGDDDVDGIPNSEDECPDQKETINGVQDEDGCPDGGPAKVIREGGSIVILESIKFRSGSAQIDPESHSVLNQIALVMKANPDIKVVRIEGHTDNTGDHDMNMKLSKDRAESVRVYLVQRGIKPARLKAEGFGPDRPVVDSDDPASLAKNRRVEFHIED